MFTFTAKYFWEHFINLDSLWDNLSILTQSHDLMAVDSPNVNLFRYLSVGLGFVGLLSNIFNLVIFIWLGDMQLRLASFLPSYLA
jgi:hypothetical protein